MKTKILIAGSLLAMILAACTPAAGTQPAAVLNALEWLADRLGVDAGSIVITNAEQVDWSDSCLELGGPAESCLAAITPGWRITFEVNGVTYEVHTDQNASIIRLAGDELLPAGSVELDGTSWTLESFGTADAGAEGTPVLPGTTVSLVFQGAGIVGGSGGCNTFGGTYSLAGSEIAFQDIFTTEMACLDEGVMDQESKFYAALGSAERFELTDGALKIWYDGGSATLNFVSLIEIEL